MADTEKGGNGVSREQADPRPERPDNVSGPCVSAPRNHETHRSLRRQLARHLQARLATGSLGATCDSCTSSLPSSTGAPPPSPLLLESELLLLSLATGIQDATTFPDYACFASNQTGNTVLFAVGAAGLARDAFELANIAMSLGVFVAGCVLSGQAGNYLVGKRGRPSRRRWWVLASNAVSTALVVAAVAVQWVEQLRKQREHAEMGTPMHGVSAVGVIDVDRTGPAALGVIALLAFASAMQVTIARPLGVPQITTAMATAAWVDLLMDPRLLAVSSRGKPTRDRDRRALFIGALAVGSFVGAFSRARVGSALALLLSALVKAAVTAMFWFNRAEVAEEDRDPEEEAPARLDV